MRIIHCLIVAVGCIPINGCRNTEPVFDQVPASHSHISFENNLQPRKAFGILYYLYYYNGGGVATGDINNDGLADIYFTANSLGGNKLYLNKGNFVFEDISKNAGVEGHSDWCSGVTMADVNGDGWLDIYVSAVANHHGLTGRNELFINKGKNVFEESAAAYGLNFSGFTTQAAFFDFDHDGDLDCYLLNQSHKPNENIVDTANRRKPDAFAGDRLYRNDLNTSLKKFIDVTAQAGIYQSSLGYGLGLAVADLNNDGWEDIYVGNDFHENDYYYVNNGNGTFTESGARHFGHYSRFSMGNDAADYNNDGQLDIITVDMLPGDEKVLKTYGSDENPDIYRYKLINHGYQYQYSKNCLQRNNGNGSSFSDISLQAGVSATDWSWSPLFADFDNDGNKDLFISSGIVKRPVDLDYVKFISNVYNHKALNSTDRYDDQALEKMPGGASHPFLFRGDGELGFRDVSAEWGVLPLSGFFNGASYADLDNDGRLDLVINALNAPAVVLKNNAPATGWLNIALKGEGLNRNGIGAKLYVFANGNMQYQQMMPTRGFQSSSDQRLHFGMGNAQRADSLLVVWPDQRFQWIKNVPVNRPFSVEQSKSSGKFSYEETFGAKQEALVRVPSPPWCHRENAFDDNNVQYLIPHAESTRGPRTAAGDVNGDGLDDLYACGAKGQPGSLLVQQPGGAFRADSSMFRADAASEDVDAIFFDANGDGYADLYAMSGGNEYDDGNPLLADRLYLNDGNGVFARKQLPPMMTNKSCVAVADIDGDGDSDIFVGTLASAMAYGVPQNSYLLINDGRANFSIAGPGVIDLRKAGMITSAVFADVNRDRSPDLVVAGEWMPITIFINKKGKFQKQALPGSTGMWQKLYAADLNADGHMDLLAGNWGWNNKFYSGKNGPVKMYVADFDHNGQTDQLVSYTLNGQEFPFLAKDEVERPLPTLRKHYLLYSEYAGVPMKDVFYGWIDTVKPLVCERLGSVAAYGDGRGNFELRDLPANLQLSPIFAFTSFGDNRYACGGNFFDAIPYEGRYDAQSLAMFDAVGDSIRFSGQFRVPQFAQQVRDLKLLRTTNGEQLLSVASNNDSLMFFRVSRK